jgi:hypothetical protein
MLSGVSRDRPVIVGWSTAPRGQVIEESLGQLPKKLAAGPRVLARTESLRTQSGTKQGGPPHDHWAKLGQLRYTRSQYAFVVIALFSMKFIAPPSKKRGLRRIEWVIFGLKTRETWGLRRDFAFYGIWNLSMTDGWHEHRNVDGGFGIHIRFLVFDLNRQCAAFLVTRKRA